MGNTGKTGKPFLLKVLLFGVAFSAILTSAAQFFPDPVIPWLSFKRGLGPGAKEVGNETEARQYYAAIKPPPGRTVGAPLKFEDWEKQYFSGTDIEQAKYYNSVDLGFGRDLTCKDDGTRYLACVLINHGFGPGGPPQLAANDAIDGKNTLARVAMVHDRRLQFQSNDVTFYVYDENGDRLIKVPLDSEIEDKTVPEKFVPHVCLACHGGAHDAATNQVSGANFLPFDLAAFEYSKRPDPDFSRKKQEPTFRRLNEMVLKTMPDRPIEDLILGWYKGIRLSNGSISLPLPPNDQDDNFVPTAYDGNPLDRSLYLDVVKPYCQTCHVAQRNLPLDTPQQVSTLAKIRVFDTYEMPHAERTAHNFWTDDGPMKPLNTNAPAFLADNRGFSIQVTRLDNRFPPMLSSCGLPSAGEPPSSDCTLREAIIKANTNGGRDIITFAVDGTFNPLGDVAGDDDANSGDLDITDDLTILGNGATNTIIDGSGIDRVFHILKRPGEAKGPDLVIQGVTIQNGDPFGAVGAGSGGGISNIGGKLTLNHSVLRNNRGTTGGAIENLDAIVEINQSTIGPANDAIFGGGIDNTRTKLRLNNSTVSGNTADDGSGIANGGVGAVVEIFHSTITRNTAETDNIFGTAGGIDNIVQGRVTIRNSIVAGNTGSGSAVDCSNASDATFMSLGSNLVGQNGDSNGCPTTSTDRVLAGSIGTAINTNLQGFPPFHALVFGSPAIDAIPRQPFGTRDPSCTPPSYDQRNMARPLDGDADDDIHCDIGAIELTSTNLSVEITDFPDPVRVGNNLTYTMTVTNTGPDNATGVTLTDTLPSGVTFVSVTFSQGSCSGIGIVTCNLGSVANGANALVRIVVTPTAAGAITNTVSVRANEPDPDETNNSDREETTVRAGAVSVFCDGLRPTTGCRVNGVPNQLCLGTPGNDNIVGTAGADVILGLGGHDTINGLGGNDRICGGSGNDAVSGGEDRDRLFGQDGRDILRGAAGDDTLEGGQGSDQLFGGDDRDTLRGSAGNDTLEGNRGRDRLFGEAGRDTLRGGMDDDTLSGGQGGDQLFGDAGKDSLRGDSDGDTLSGQDGNDALDGGLGVDRCIGGLGTDSAIRCEGVFSTP